MYPHERSLVKRLKNQPFALIGVNSDKDLTQLKARMQEENISWRSYWQGDLGTSGPISTKWNVRGWPTIFVLDHKGVIRFKGPRRRAMDEAVNQLLTEMGVDLGDDLYSEEEKKEPEQPKAPATTKAIPLRR